MGRYAIIGLLLLGVAAGVWWYMKKSPTLNRKIVDVTPSTKGDPLASSSGGDVLTKI